VPFFGSFLGKQKGTEAYLGLVESKHSDSKHIAKE
jgi:hypothetical protein